MAGNEHYENFVSCSVFGVELIPSEDTSRM